MDQTGRSCVAIADIQGFVINKRDFILKELCFTILDSEASNNSNNNNKNNQYHHYIFKPPFNWSDLTKQSRANANWLHAFHHGFFWNQGQISYNNRGNYIKPLLKENLIILVKGYQKVQWVKECCQTSDIDVRNIEEEEYVDNFRLEDVAYELINKHHCRLHKIVKHCAKQNVKIIENWWKQYNHSNHFAL